METLLPVFGLLDPWMIMVVVLGYLGYKAYKAFLDDDNDIQGQ